MAKQTNRVAWWIWLICSRLHGWSAARAREEYDQFGRLCEQMSGVDSLDGVPERERRWNRLVRNGAWLVSPIFAAMVLLVTLQKFSPWAKYALVILGTIPLTVLVALGIELLAALCYEVARRRDQSR